MDVNQRLLALLETERRRAEAAEKRAGIAELQITKERQRTEEEKQRAEEEKQRAEEEKQRAENATRYTRKTTLHECLTASHELQASIVVETDKSLTTKGSTSIKNKLYPQTLRSWDDFPEIHQRLFDAAYHYFHPDYRPPERHFNSLQYYQELGDNLRRRPLASEQDLETWQRIAVEDTVAIIINAMCEMPEARADFGLGQGVTFDNHINSLAEISDDIQRRLHDVFNRTTIPVFRERGGSSTDGDETAREAKLQYNADKLVVAVVTQTFHTMIDFGLEYSFITTGEALVQLHVKKDDPTTLYYQLSIPKEVLLDTNDTASISQTAVGQVMTMCLMAFQSSQRSHKWRRAAKKKLERHRTDYEAILRELPESERKQTPNVAYRGRKLPTAVRSPVVTRQRTQRAAANAGCSKDTPVPSDDSEDDPDTSSKSAGGSNSARDRSSRYKATSDTTRRQGRKDNTKTQKRQQAYCTQACMLGILKAGTMDKNCPNVSWHPSTNGHHELNAPKLVALIRQQLAADVDHGCEPLGLHGARGALFRISLKSHGYVLVAKGMLHSAFSYMLHEIEMYRYLEPLQGDYIPVCLGHFCLRHRFYLDLGVKIKYMMLMAWGGQMVENEKNYRIQVDTTVKTVQSYGVEQGDVRRPNLLWNKEKQQVMLIDFERAVHNPSDAAASSLGTKRQVLRELSSHTGWKRQRVSKAYRKFEKAMSEKGD
ncbi:MAG: hypothetical protein MMC23_009922, partial [Stictis urceolatum]|nr:hypothetical protein [Stictis urceolata]